MLRTLRFKAKLAAKQHKEDIKVLRPPYWFHRQDQFTIWRENSPRPTQNYGLAFSWFNNMYQRCTITKFLFPWGGNDCWSVSWLTINSQKGRVTRRGKLLFSNRSVISLVWRINRREPNALPLGTPETESTHWRHQQLHLAAYGRAGIQTDRQYSATCAPRPRYFSLLRLTQSNAALKSNWTTWYFAQYSKPSVCDEEVKMHASTQPWPYLLQNRQQGINQIFHKSRTSFSNTVDRMGVLIWVSSSLWQGSSMRNGCYICTACTNTRETIFDESAVEEQCHFTYARERAGLCSW